MSMTRWAAWDVLMVVGVSLEIIGLLVVIAGLDVLANELFPEHALPVTRTRRAVTRWWRRMTGGASAASEGTINLTVESAVMAMDAQSVGVTVQPATREERLTRLEQDMALLRDALDDERHQRNDHDEALQDQISGAHTDLDARLSENELRTRRCMGGERGAGLASAFWGASVTVVGVILQGAASVWG